MEFQLDAVASIPIVYQIKKNGIHVSNSLFADFSLRLNNSFFRYSQLRERHIERTKWLISRAPLPLGHRVATKHYQRHC